MMNANAIKPGYIQAKDFSNYVPISRRTLGDWMKQGKLPFVRVSRKLVLFKLTDIDTALDAMKIEGRAAN